jgi:DNA repair exonuclease SbcCD ATPase subunit
MKKFGAILIAAVTLPVLLLLGFFLLWPREAPARPTFIISFADDVGQFEESLRGREAVYQAQLDALEETLAQQQDHFQNQAEAWQAEVNLAQKRLDALKRQQQDLETEIATLEATRTERLDAYQAQLEQMRWQLQERIRQLETQLADAQATLDDVTAQLRAQ